MSLSKLSFEDFLSGKVFLINKPLKWTSFDVVNKIRHEISKKFGHKKIKVGHAGTLDPLASGLLIICVGKKTKEITSFQNLSKEYTGTFVLGATTPSYDLETNIDQEFDVSGLTESQLHENVKHFKGFIKQVPPIFSAKKVKGETAYNVARRGETVILESKQVEIIHFELTDVRLPEVDFMVQCSKGTYIRSLVHDFGKALNNGAYLKALKRTKIGDYSVEDAMEVKEFIERLIVN